MKVAVLLVLIVAVLLYHFRIAKSRRNLAVDVVIFTAIIAAWAVCARYY